MRTLFFTYKSSWKYAVVFLACFVWSGVAQASYQEYAPGSTIVLGEFLYNDDYTPSTDACYLSVFAPNGATTTDTQLMTADANGWHHYSFTASSTEGTWPAYISCGSGGSLVKENQTFVITSNIVSSSSVATLVNANTNTAVSNASTSLASVINANTTSSVLTASSSLGASINAVASAVSSVPTAVWAFGTRTLSSFGTLASDIWSNSVRTLTGAGLTSGSLAVQSDVTAASSSVASVINAHTDTGLATATSSLAAVVNANTNSATAGVTTAVNAHTDIASSSIGSLLASITSSISNIPANVWASATRTLSSGASIASDIWSAATRTLTGAGLSSGSLAVQSDVTAASSSLASVINANTNSVVGVASTSLGAAIHSLTVSSGGWTAQMSDFSDALAGGTYRTRVTLYNQNTLADPVSAPTVTVYDSSRNAVVSGVAMTKLSTGVYEYTYSISSSAAAGTWETVASITASGSNVLQTNDYWDVVTNPAQVLIQSMGSTETPAISAHIRITNEGSADNEYPYEWCVVSDPSNICGGGDDTYYASAAKLIHPGENFDTTLTATVPLAGTYYFKVVAYFGTRSSSASRQFTATAPAVSTGGDSGNSGGGGGGGGGGGAAVAVAPAVSTKAAESTPATAGDINGDGKINGTDFSVLLAYWKAKAPFKNPTVDLNHDGKIDSVDFSILLYLWKK